MDNRNRLYVGAKFAKEMKKLEETYGEAASKEYIRRFIEDTYRFLQDHGRLPSVYDSYGTRVPGSVPPVTGSYTTSTESAPSVVEEPEEEDPDSEAEEAGTPEYSLPPGQTAEVEGLEPGDIGYEPPVDEEEDSAAIVDENDYDDLLTPWQMPKNTPMAPWWRVKGYKNAYKLYNKYKDLDRIPLNGSKKYKGASVPHAIKDKMYTGKHSTFHTVYEFVEFPVMFVPEEVRKDSMKDWIEIGLSYWHPEFADFGRKKCKEAGLI